MQTQDMRLNALSLEQLQQLTDTMGVLAAAGGLVTKGGLLPTFSLTPGWKMTMWLDFAMPEVFAGEDVNEFFTTLPAAGQSGEDTLPQDSSLVGAVGSGRGGGEPLVAATEIAVSAPAPSVACAEAPAAKEPAAGAPDLVVAADTTGDGGAVDHMVISSSAPAPEVRAVEGPTSAVPPAVVASPAGVKGVPDRWSAEEDGRALAIYRAALQSGVNKEMAILAVAKEIGRPFGGVAFRFKTKLGEQVALATLAVMRETQAKAAPPPTRAARAPSAPPAAPPDLAGHLRSLPDVRGWNRDWDVTVMQEACDGFDLNAIASDLGCDAGAVKARFDALTGVYKDANDKICRRFSREQVRDQLLSAPAKTAAE